MYVRSYVSLLGKQDVLFSFLGLFTEQFALDHPGGLFEFLRNIRSYTGRDLSRYDGQQASAQSRLSVFPSEREPHTVWFLDGVAASPQAPSFWSSFPPLLQAHNSPGPSPLHAALDSSSSKPKGSGASLCMQWKASREGEPRAHSSVPAPAQMAPLSARESSWA